MRIRDARKKALARAAAWFGNDKLLTEPALVKIADDLALIEVGRIVAIEYESKKYDGKTRVYRHNVVKTRILYISTDGEVLIIKPGLKITKRGIEG